MISLIPRRLSTLAAFAVGASAAVAIIAIGCIDGTTPDCSGADSSCGPAYDGNFMLPDGGDAAPVDASGDGALLDAPAESDAPGAVDAPTDTGIADAPKG